MNGLSEYFFKMKWTGMLGTLFRCQGTAFGEAERDVHADPTETPARVLFKCFNDPLSDTLLNAVFTISYS